ncbi:MAG: hypothetical protein HQ551_08410 [Desulfobacteraceae bacterium]|nr:hypothetical protein [Desulfobacteraceae bacterium]
MERAKARFQALSAFTGIGFTTRDAEAVVNHPRRRKIVTSLMVLGNASIVTVIATFVVSLRPAGIFRPSLNIAIVAASLLILYRITLHQEFAKKLSNKIRETLRKKLHFEKVYIEEILQQSERYGVASVLIKKESKIAGLTLGQSGLRGGDLMVLSIERDEEVIPVPKTQSKIQVGDRLIIYGKMENLKDLT